MSEKSSFELTHEERSYFQRLFRRELWPFGAAVVVVLALFWGLGIKPLRNVRPVTGNEFTEHAGIALDLRTEVERLVAEYSTAPSKKTDSKAAAPDPRVNQALKDITKLLAAIEKSRSRDTRIEKRIGDLEKTKSVPAAATGAAAGTPAGNIDLDKYRERLFNIELRQDREEKKGETFFKDVLARVEKLEVRQGEAEDGSAGDVRAILERIAALEARLSAAGN